MDDSKELIDFLKNKLCEKDSLLKEKDNSIIELKNSILTLLEMMKLMKLRAFASRSEKNVLPNGDIFNSDEEEVTSKPEETISVSTHQRKKPKREKLPAILPRIDIFHDLKEEEKICSCGCSLTYIGKLNSEQLDIIPKIIQVLCHHRKKYVCKACNVIKIAERPVQPIPKSIASPGLLSHIVVSKFCDHLPLYRQAQIFSRNDIDLSRGTLSQWIIRCGQLVQPIINLMREKILDYDIAYADESRLQVLKEEGKSAESQSYMWVFGGGQPEEFSWHFNYEPTRGSSVPMNFFDGFKGFLHVDGYAGYNKLQENNQIVLVNCMAHARRKFAEIAKLSKKKNGVSHEVLARIGRLYKIEKVLKETKSSPDKIKQTRHEKSKAVLEELFIYLEKKQKEVLQNSALGKAINYILNHWQGLIRYLEDGRLEIDNNRTERTIKPFATGRKNWLFCDSVKGANASANLYSLIETCKFHEINVYYYLKHLFSEIKKCTTVEDFEKLLPYRFKNSASFSENP